MLQVSVGTRSMSLRFTTLDRHRAMLTRGDDGRSIGVERYAFYMERIGSEDSLFKLPMLTSSSSAQETLAYVEQRLQRAAGARRLRREKYRRLARRRHLRSSGSPCRRPRISTPQRLETASFQVRRRRVVDAQCTQVARRIDQRNKSGNGPRTS